jgi:hypothetical protein
MPHRIARSRLAQGRGGLQRQNGIHIESCLIIIAGLKPREMRALPSEKQSTGNSFTAPPAILLPVLFALIAALSHDFETPAGPTHTVKNARAIVLLNNQHPSEFAHSVMIANTEASAAATRHLIDLGRLPRRPERP